MHAPIRRPERLIQLILLFAILALVAACGPTVGDRGTLPPSSPAGVPTDTPPTEPSEPADSPEPSEPPAATPSPATTPAPTPTPRPTATARPAATPTPTPSGATSVKVYLLADGRLVPAVRSIDATRAVGRAALAELLEGPTRAESGASPALTTTIPDGTRLLGLEIERGTARVDLSRAFESGGGSASMFGRLAQVVFTLTQFPTVDRVAFLIEGSPVSVFSAEGIVLDGPSVRADFEDFLPPIFVDRPAWGGTLSSPARVTGLANVFEAAFTVEIRDADGRVLVSRPAMATCGTGCWGTFDVTLRFTVDERQTGSLVVYTHSARDGSVQDLRSYPVRLRP